MKNRIGHKLVIAIVLFSSIITLITTAFQLYFYYQIEMKRINNYGTLIKDSYLDSITTSVWMYNNIQIETQLNGLLRLPDMEHLEIHSEEGYNWSAGTIKSKHNLIKEFPLFYNHKGNDVSIGLLRAVISIDSIYSGLFYTALTTLATNAVKIFLIAGFILLIFQYLITRHLYLLLSWLKNLDIGRSFEKFQIHRTKWNSKDIDELDEVVSAINTLLDKLKNYLESEERFKRLIENLQETHFLYKYDLPDKFTYLSSSITNVLGYSKEEFLMHYSKYITGNQLNRGASHRTEINIQSKKQPSFEIEIQHKKGSTCYLQIMETPVFNKKGEIIAVEGLAHDITERKKIETQLRQAQKMEAIGTLAGGVAHDFNNILGIIIGYSQLYMDDADIIDKPEINSSLHEILNAANRAKDLIKQILTFSRQTETEKKPIRITPIINEIVSFIRATLPATIDVRSDINIENDIIMADPVKIYQVLMNLCVNSGHAMKDIVGVLTISLMETHFSESDIIHYPGLRNGSYLKLSVKDTGYGIPKQYQERIFEPYFTTKNKEEGTGLGLAVVHAIIKEHGGDIKVYSEAGTGTVFNVFLPMAETIAGHIEYEYKSTNVIPTGNERILLIDDEQSLVSIMKKMLDSIGYTVVAETNPFEALERFNKFYNSFDLVITDKTMPQMTGFDLAKRVKNIKSGIPIILSTGLSESKDKNEAAMDLIEDILIKPVNIEMLAKTVRKVLDNYKVREVTSEQQMKNYTKQQQREGTDSKVE